MRLRTFDDGGRLRVSACRRYQGSMSTSLPADGCAGYIIIGCFRAVFKRKPLRPLRKRKDVAEGPRFRSRQARPSRRSAQLSVATSATLPQLSVTTSATFPAHRAAFGRDRRDPPGASRSFRSRQARPSRRIAQLSVATSATLPAHRAAPRRGRRGYFACRAVRGEPYVPSRGTGLAGIRPWQP